MKPACYLTDSHISMFAETPGDYATGAQFQSRRSSPSATISRLRLNIAVGHAAVKTLAKRFHVSGNVQGVGFRFFAERVANRLGVNGYVKNLFDGGVEVYAIGNDAQLSALKTELQRGPRMASVDRVAESDAELLSEFSNGFSVEREL
jgi:acylphosphatase